MAEVTTSRFSCEGCGRSYALKPELVGRRVKCKCGQVMTVPQPPPPPAPEEADDLYDLAPDPAESVTKPKPRVPLAPISPRVPLAPVQGSSGALGMSHVGGDVAAASRAGGAGAAVGAGIPLTYQQAATQRDRQRMSMATLVDMKRDVYAPVTLLVTGFLLYVGFYMFRYEMGGTGVALVSMGLGVMTVFKAALLIGFAFVVAGPLGVSFGGIWTAALKLAAIAVFCDGATTWIDYGADLLAGAAVRNIAGWGVISFPIALGIYWVLLIYLFSMDSGDSWLVVILLTLFAYIVRLVLLMLLLRAILGMGGVAGAAIPVPALGGGAPIAVDPMTERMNELKEMKLLREAREYIAGGRQAALSDAVEAWYAAGCRNVWFSVSRDINGRESPRDLIIELPKDQEKDKAARQRCYDILKAYLDEHKLYYNPKNMTDTGEAYITMPVR